jgi:hypothetical protein
MADKVEKKVPYPANSVRDFSDSAKEKLSELYNSVLGSGQSVNNALNYPVNQVYHQLLHPSPGVDISNSPYAKQVAAGVAGIANPRYLPFFILDEAGVPIRLGASTVLAALQGREGLKNFQEGNIGKAVANGLFGLLGVHGVIKGLSPTLLDEERLGNARWQVAKRWQKVASRINKARRVSVIKQHEKLAKRLIKDNTTYGGATYRLNGKNMAGTPNYAVSYRPDLTETITGNVPLERVRRFIVKHRKILSDPRTTVGIWKQGNKTYLDVTALVPHPHLDKALKLSKDANQIAITDLSKVKPGEFPPDDAFINVGGTGEQLPNFVEPDLSHLPFPAGLGLDLAGGFGGLMETSKPAERVAHSAHKGLEIVQGIGNEEGQAKEQNRKREKRIEPVADH